MENNIENNIKKDLTEKYLMDIFKEYDDLKDIWKKYYVNYTHNNEIDKPEYIYKFIKRKAKEFTILKN